MMSAGYPPQQPPYRPNQPYRPQFSQPPAPQYAQPSGPPPPGYRPPTGYGSPPGGFGPPRRNNTALIVGAIVLALALIAGIAFVSTRQAAPQSVPPTPSTASTAAPGPASSAPDPSQWGTEPPSTAEPTTQAPPVEHLDFVDTTDGRFRVYLDAPLWRDGVAPWAPFEMSEAEHDLVSLATDQGESIRIALEDWGGGPQITAESIQEQMRFTGAPPGFLVGDPPPITIAGAVPLGMAYDTPFVYMNTYYLELVGDQAVIILISAGDKATADALAAWCDGRIMRL